MLYNEIELNVLIKGRPITEFPHRGQVFVEGRAGSEYEIEVRNRTNQRVEAVITVDGLSVTDGQPGSDRSSGYVIEPFGSVCIPGWKVDGATAARFAFSGRKGGSYAVQMTGSDRNDGVIGALVYREEPVLQMRRQSYPKGIASAQPHGWSGLVDSVATASLRGLPMNTSMSASMEPVQTLSSASASTFVAPDEQSRRIGAVANAPVVQQSLGTEFGEAADFRTDTVDFRRGDLHAALVVFYDDARGLRARGIKLVRPSKQRFEHQPNPFPGMTGCAPPPGWSDRRR